MGDSKKNKPGEPATGRAGRIVVDDRGRNVWQWDDQQLDSTTSLLRKLDNMSLAIESTNRFEKPALDLDARKGGRSHPEASGQAEPGRGTSAGDRAKNGVRAKKPAGFNPYDNS